MTRILIIEDNLKTSDYLMTALNENYFLADKAEDGQEGIFLASQNSYDVIILDIMLPKLDGWSVLKKIREQNQRICVLLLTACHSVTERVKGFDLGADDYLIKPFAFSELLARIRSLLKRQILPHPDVLQITDLTIDISKHKAMRGNTQILLTAKEFMLLLFLARRQGEVLSRTLIAEQVWDIHFACDTKAIDMAIKRLRDKIDEGFNNKLIHTVRGIGMFWKIESEKPLSLKNKMIMLYSFTTMVIVALVCIILFPSFEKITHVYNTAYKDHLLSQCMISLFVALTLSFISTLIFSIMIAIKSTKQIDLLSEQIKYTNINSLSEKIKLNHLPKELKPIGESFNTMLDQIKNSFDQISQFSSDLAHELRNPIHNLLGMNELALSHPCTIEKHHDTFESNLEECRYLFNLIENLWFIARSDYGFLAINKSVLNAHQEILKIMDYYDSYSKECDVQISCTGDALLSADVILFKRAISNILSNALKYTFKKGKIKIEIEKSEKTILISIQDTGLGIEEKHLSKLCTRFYRVDPSRSSQTGGLGLGLAIVKSIMDLHQGKISIKSVPHIGTTVFLYFPA